MMKQKNMIERNSINYLSSDLIIDILARVAAHSFKDFINVKLSCRQWNELADDCNVYKHVSLPEFFDWKVPESEEYKRKSNSLLHKCADAGNLEALYIKGMVDYLEGKEPEHALECLKKAANAGHVGAEYVVCMISIHWGGEEDWKTGTHCLKAMMQSNELRKKARKALGQLITAFIKAQMYNLRTVTKRPPRCCTSSDHMFRNMVAVEDDKEVECVSCRCDSDISHLSHILNLFKSLTIYTVRVRGDVKIITGRK